jgi:hypothetical protein
MNKRDEISATMAIALAEVHEHGRLVRYQGGYWATDMAPRDHNGIPIDHFGTSTINGLIKRGRLVVTEWKKGSRPRYGRLDEFPIAVKLAESETP